MDSHVFQRKHARHTSRQENMGEGTWGNNERNETNGGIPRRHYILRKPDTLTSFWF